MNKVLLDHDFCKITNKGQELEVKIKMHSGGWVLNRPFPSDLRGQIAALTLALDIISGKVILDKVSNDIELSVTQPKLLGDNK